MQPKVLLNVDRSSEATQHAFKAEVSMRQSVGLVCLCVQCQSKQLAVTAVPVAVGSEQSLKVSAHTVIYNRQTGKQGQSKGGGTEGEEDTDKRQQREEKAAGGGGVFSEIPATLGDLIYLHTIPLPLPLPSTI